jgi:putative SOS response-associated peptidase YedK
LFFANFEQNPMLNHLAPIAPAVCRRLGGPGLGLVACSHHRLVLAGSRGRNVFLLTEKDSYALDVCNLYNVRTNQAAIRDIARAMRDSVGNLPPLPGIYPDYPAAIVRTAVDGVRELAMARCGMPSPAFALKGKKTDPGVTNVRNPSSPHWRRWPSEEHRCLVPLTAFSEPERQPDGESIPAWFALSEDPPLMFFAGIWRPAWASVRKLKEGEVTTDLYAFLTTEPNAEVASIHPKAMPVILTERDELDAWMTAPWAVAKELQRPLPDGMLRILGRGKSDTPEEDLPAGVFGPPKAPSRP